MLTRIPQSLFAGAALLCVSCSSTPQTSSQAPIEPSVQMAEVASEEASQASPDEAQAREIPDFFAPKAWTGAFTETAVMVADVVRIEGPEGLLDHVAAASDDSYYERTAEVTNRGFRQTIRRLGPDAPEIRVRIDFWTIAATKRVVILENINACEVSVVAGGDAIWRDVDGNVAQADRLEFIGEIGQNTPVRPVFMDGATAAQAAPSPAQAAAATEAVDGTASDEGASADESTPKGGSHSDASEEPPVQGAGVPVPAQTPASTSDEPTGPSNSDA